MDQTIETYFLDFDGDLYGIHIAIEILSHIREEKNFESVDMLVKAMREDEVFSRKYIQSIKV